MAPTELPNHRSRRQVAPGTGAPATGRHRARKGEGDKLRNEILDAAERLLAEKGSPDEVSMRSIASAVGVSPPAIYMHFDDKDELFFECCFRRFHEMSEVMAAAASRHDDPPAQIRATGRAYIEFGLAHPEHYEVLMLGPIPDKAAQLEPDDFPGAGALAMAAEIVSRGMETGVFRQDLDPVATSVVLWASVHGAVVVLLAKRRQPVQLFEDEDAVIEQLLDVLGRGLLA